MKRFDFIRSARKINLILKEAVSDLEVRADIFIDGEEIAVNEICQLAVGKNDEIFLTYGEDNYFCICDLRTRYPREREMVDYIWEDLMNRDVNHPLYKYTSAYAMIVNQKIMEAKKKRQLDYLR